MTTKSNCVNYSSISTTPIVVTINTGNYINLPTNSPVLPVTIALSSLPEPPNPFSVKVGFGTAAGYTLNVVYTNDNPSLPQGSFTEIFGCTPEFTINTEGKGRTNGSGFYIIKTPLGPINIPNATINRVTINSQTSNNGDEYLITMISSIKFNLTDPEASTACAQIDYIRKNNVTIDEGICNDKYCFCSSDCKTTRIPLINIVGQSMKTGTDVSDMTFTIFDKYTYEEKKSIVDYNQNRCQLLRLECSKLKVTTFVKCCPWMVLVTRGKGSTLNEKLQDLISKNLQPSNMDIKEFLRTIIKYGMTRYILSRILYGDFNIDYLLEKHYKRFIKDLGRSRFCRFIEFFENCTISPDFPESFVGYEKYFLCDKKC